MPGTWLQAGTVVTSPLVPDVDPNTGGGPTTDRIGNIPERTENGKISEGLKVAIQFSNFVSDPDITIVLWIFDETSGLWFKGLEVSGIKQSDAIQFLNVAPNRFTLQVTVFNAGGGSADDVTLYYQPL